MTQHSGEIVDRCPMCWHSVRQHVDGIARQELNEIGCTTCVLCEVTRMSLVVPQSGNQDPS